jgi:hypothetical protein
MVIFLKKTTDTSSENSKYYTFDILVLFFDNHCLSKGEALQNSIKKAAFTGRESGLSA